MNQVMHLFPRRSNKTQCGTWGIMTTHLEDVTCKECLSNYKRNPNSTAGEQLKTKPEDVHTRMEETNGMVGNSGNDGTDYSFGLTGRV